MSIVGFSGLSLVHYDQARGHRRIYSAFERA